MGRVLHGEKKAFQISFVMPVLRFILDSFSSKNAPHFKYCHKVAKTQEYSGKYLSAGGFGT